MPFSARRLARIGFLCTGLASLHAQASPHMLGIGATGGLPHMLGVDLRFLGLRGLEIGLSMGSVPLNTLLEGQIPLDPIPVDLDQPDPYAIIPSTDFKLTAFTPYLRLYPWAESFYIQTSYSIWRFRANIYGDLENQTTGATASSVVTGYLDISQTVITPEIGWRFWPTPSVFFDLGVGVSILRSVEPESYVSSSLAGVLSASPEGEAALEEAQEEVRTQVDAGVAAYRDKIKILPALHLTLGVAF